MYYQEITIVEMSHYKTWEDIYTKLHQHLAKLHKSSVGEYTKFGVSFPEYIYTEKNGKVLASLGSKLRIFSNSEQALKELNLEQLLASLSDYVHIKTIREVPANAKPIMFKRYHAKGNKRIEQHNQRIANFLAKKSGKTVNEWLQELASTKHQAECKLPYVWLTSASTNKKFKLFIKCEKVSSMQNNQEKFNCYGLSSPECGFSFVYEF